MPEVCVLVLALTDATTELDAELRSLWVASEPELRLALVSVRDAPLQTSATKVPKVLRLRVEYAHTEEGIERIELVIALRLLPSELDAASTVALVLLFTDDTMPDVWVLVLAFTTAASEVEAVESALLVLALITAASDDVAVVSAESVWPLTPEVIPAVALLVFALMLEASEEDALATIRAVLLFTTDAMELEALVMSEVMASEPELRFAPVSVRVVLLQISAASVPKLLKLRVV